MLLAAIVTGIVLHGAAGSTASDCTCALDQADAFHYALASHPAACRCGGCRLLAYYRDTTGRVAHPFKPKAIELDRTDWREVPSTLPVKR